MILGGEAVHIGWEKKGWIDGMDGRMEGWVDTVMDGRGGEEEGLGC